MTLIKTLNDLARFRDFLGTLPMAAVGQISNFTAAALLFLL